MNTNIHMSNGMSDHFVSAHGKADAKQGRKGKGTTKRPAQRPLPSRKDRKELTTADCINSWRNFRAKYLEKS